MLFVVVIPLPHAAWARVFQQQGPKLVGPGPTGSPEQGGAVALSADGSTLIVGGPGDANGKGAAWVFTRSNGVWSAQGNKLVAVDGGTDRVGYSVALSADGNTALVGAPLDGGTGAAFVFVRNGGIWTSQTKLVGTGGSGSFHQQGSSVALSADGNTALVGDPLDVATIQGGANGAAWVFTRSNGTWTQQGLKLVPADMNGQAGIGSSVSLSADGNTAVIGGPHDATDLGAAWVFTRTAGAWAQYGNKLVGLGGTSSAEQGSSVAIAGDGRTILVGGPFDGSAGSGAGATWVFVLSNAVWTQQNMLIGPGTIPGAQGFGVSLSSDGNTALIGGPSDGSGAGAAWVWVRNNGTWTVPGGKMVGAGASGAAFQGNVSLSADASTAALGGPHDASDLGATWIFARSAAHDFNGDSNSDILFENTGGGMALWLMNSNAAIGSAIGVGAINPSVWTVVGQRDLDGDGIADILLRASDGSIGEWLMNGNGTIKAANGLGTLPVGVWSIVGTGDFNNDGIGDILWYHSSGAVAVWLMNSNGALLSALGVGSLPLQWSIKGTGDFDGDGISDILWYHTSGAVAVWLMNSNGAIKAANGLGTLPVGTWSIAGTGDFNGDGISDILLSVTGNGVGIWFMNASGQVASAQAVGTMASGWTIAQTGDFNGGGKSDILWYHAASGSIGAWLLSGASIVSAVGIGSLPPAAWMIVSANSE